jgi:Ca2+/Na+ antiporter
MDNFNTIRDTQVFISFFWMQVVRLILLISLICIFGLYFFVYLRSFIAIYNCVAVLFTTLAFLFLLLGAGKQVCYQKLVNLGNIEFNDSKKKSTLWIWGLFFYAQAIPMVMVSNLLHFVDFKKMFDHLGDHKF